MGSGMARASSIRKVIADLQRERDDLLARVDQIDTAIAALNSTTRGSDARKKAVRKKAKRKMSAKGRAAISRAAKKRWAEYRREQKKGSEG